MAKILSLMLEAGSGHKIPAIAITEQMEKLDKSIKCTVMDPSKKFNSFFMEKIYKKGWNFFLRKPLLFSIIYPLLKGNSALLLEMISTASLKKRIEEYVKKEKPDLIFTTYFSFAQVLGRLKKKGAIDAPTAVIVTDAFDPHRSWISKYLDYTIIYSKDSREKLKKYGLKDGQIKIMNFPLRKEFDGKKQNIPLLRKKLGLKNKFTATLLSGGEGIGKLDRFVKEFAKSDPDMQMVVICGKNERLKKKIEGIAESSKTKKFSLKACGFVTNMQEYMAASDIMMGKSGLSFMFESLICRKPMIITQTISNEKPALKFFLKKRVCWYRKNPEKMHDLVIKLMENKELYRKCTKNIENLNLKNGTREIAELLVNALRKRPKGSKK